jgi:hypothetical protein
VGYGIDGQFEIKAETIGIIQTKNSIYNCTKKSYNKSYSNGKSCINKNRRK